MRLEQFCIAIISINQIHLMQYIRGLWLTFYNTWNEAPVHTMGDMKFNTLRPRRDRRHFADDIFKHIFLNENVIISTKISLKFVPKGPIKKFPAVFQIMAWRLPGDKPLSEEMMVSLRTQICVTRPQWVNTYMIDSLLDDDSLGHVQNIFCVCVCVLGVEG